MTTRPLQILHIEDDSIDAFLMQELLSEGFGENNIDIHLVDSLSNALKAIRSNEYDIIILDLNLKDIRGMDNLSAIVAENSSVPIIVLTGVDNRKTVSEAIDIGAQDYIVKGYCNATVIKTAINSSIQRKKQQDALFQQANYDEITGLPNRKLFINHLKNAATNAQRSKCEESLIFISIDRYKEINDKHGFDITNKLVLEITSRIQDNFHDSSILSRFTDNEFVVITDDKSLKYKNSSTLFGTKLLKDLNKSINVGSKNIDFSASIYLSFFPLSNINPNTLDNDIDNTLSKARKASGALHKAG